ncbi:MAG: AAA family ATPase [Rickettsiales bacterium]|nr:MAG: AAA family ATPase [Rickettsiales bacterium]
MLKNIVIKGYKSIREVDISLNPINIVIGANGVGKSNFIRFFEFVNSVVDNEILSQIHSDDIDKYLYCGNKITKNIETKMNFKNDNDNSLTNQYRLNLEINNDRKFFFKQEESWCNNKYKRDLLNKNNTFISNLKNDDQSYYSSHTYRFISSYKIYHFNDTGAYSPFANSYLLGSNFIGANGENLASVLYKIKDEFPDDYKLIIRRIQFILPFFDDFILEPNKEEYISLKWKQKGINDIIFNTLSMSDGSIRYIALTTLINLPEKMRPTTIIIDEPELGLHHQAIKALQSMIWETSKKYNTQYILSTQSVEFIDDFSLDDIIIADKINNETKLYHPDKEKYKYWIENYTNGEMWESNIIGGNINV